MYNITRDWWCEQRMWRSAGAETGSLAEPVSMATGVVMVAFALVPNSDASAELPLLFLFYKACLVLLGIGTAVFHGMEYEDSLMAHVNLNLFDWGPIVLTITVLLGIYLQSAVRMLKNYVAVLVYMGVIVWAGFLLLAMDTSTYQALEAWGWGTLLNGLLLGPPLLILAVFTWLKFGWRAWVLWFLLAISLAAWLVNYYACQYWFVLSVLHAAYHVVMAYALLLAGCLGITIGDDWEIDGSSAWVRVRHVKGYKQLKGLPFLIN